MSRRCACVPVRGSRFGCLHSEGRRPTGTVHCRNTLIIATPSIKTATFLCVKWVETGIKQTVERPPKDHRRNKRLRVENECFVLFCDSCCTFCWLSTCCNNFKEGTKNPRITHQEGARQEGPKSHHRRNIADGLTRGRCLLAEVNRWLLQ